MSDDETLERALIARRYLYNLGMPGPALAAMESAFAEAGSEATRTAIAEQLIEWYLRREGANRTRDLTPLIALIARPTGDANRDRRHAIIRSRWIAERDIDAARALLETHLAAAPHGDLMLALANLAEPPERIDWLNRALAFHDLGRIELAEGDGLLFDRLRPVTSEMPAMVEGPLVSVIVPLFNAADTIGTVMLSLGWQSWRNIEIIVVDDLSTDGSAEVVRTAARSDPRIRLMTSERNAGAYVARNRALAEAKGEFVTVHDADDWSHPAKIERQVRHLLDHPEAMANMSMKARASVELNFVWLNPHGVHLAANASSLMFRREPTIAALGSWDSVRVGADTEFIRRLETAFGAEALVLLETGLISLQRRAEGSLTSSGVLAYAGFDFGGRREYGENSYWYRKLHPDRLRFPFPMTDRPYPAPALMLPDRQKGETRHFDMVIASDFRQRSNGNRTTIEELEANAALGLRTGLAQLSLFDLTAARRRNPWLAEAILANRAEMLVFGERIACDILLIRDPCVLAEEQAYLPEIVPEEVRIIVDRPPIDLRSDPERPLYDAASCDAYAERLFGKRPLWHPTNPLVRAALVAQGIDRLVRLSPDDWPDIVAVRGGAEPSGRQAGKRPHIGRHGPDHWSAWPASAEAILAAYPDGKERRVSILGAITAATAILGAVPGGWKVSQAKRRQQAETFLSRLDAYVYFAREGIPQYDYRNVLEAMAAGVPVVLDPAMEAVFGGLARYGEPERVRRELKRIFGEPEETARMVAEARAFVGQVHGRAAYADRLKPLVRRLSSAPATGYAGDA